MHPKYRNMTRAEKRMLDHIHRREADGFSVQYVRGLHETRVALALVRLRLVHAAVTKNDLMGVWPYPWKEIALSTNPVNLSNYGGLLSPRVKFRADRSAAFRARTRPVRISLAERRAAKQERLQAEADSSAAGAPAAAEA